MQVKGRLGNAMKLHQSPFCIRPKRFKTIYVTAALVTIQELLGHSKIKTTQRYCMISNLKVQRDYFKAMAVIIRR